MSPRTPASSTPSNNDASANTFPDLVELDALRLMVIVDNEVDFMTSVPKELGLTTQAMSLFKDKRNLDKDKTSSTTVQPTSSSSSSHTNLGSLQHHGHEQVVEGREGCRDSIRTIAFDFRDVCCGAHGLSILVTGIKDKVEHRVLFDTGPHSAIFLENARRLEIEFEKIEVVVLSHWHVDHSGGMLAAVEKCVQARQSQDLTGVKGAVIVDLHPDRPDERGICLKGPAPQPNQNSTAQYVAWGADPSFEELEKAGAKIEKHSEAHTICDGYFGVSGVIPRITTYETGIPNHVRWSNETKVWMSEPEIMDERYLVAKVKGKGIIALTGCSHAGVINVCQDVDRAFAAAGVEGQDNGLYFVVGGFHLAGGTVEPRIQETVRDMLELNPSFMAPGHCSGWRVKAALEKEMPGRVVSLGVGSDFFITHREPRVVPPVE